VSNHLTGKEIDYYVSGLASAEDAARARRHLDSCPQCRKLAETLSSVITEGPSDSIPRIHVREAVMSHWHKVNYQIAEKESGEKPVINRFTAGLALAASFILIISAYLFLGRMKADDGYLLTLHSVSGEVYLNGSAAADDSVITTGSLVQTGKTGDAVVSASGYMLYIGNSSSLAVSRNSNRRGIRFLLDEGAVISKSSGDIAYSFSCGKYDVSPVGTDFMIKCSIKKAEVAVSQGIVKVEAPDMSVEISEGRIWSSEKPGELAAIDPATALIINTGRFSNRLTNKDMEKRDINKTEITGEKENSESNINGSEEKRDREEIREKAEIKQMNRELRQERKDINDFRREQRAERKGRKSE
jgi:hypothetical protein